MEIEGILGVFADATVPRESNQELSRLVVDRSVRAGIASTDYYMDDMRPTAYSLESIVLAVKALCGRAE